jgi:hypothetical protein
MTSKSLYFFVLSIIEIKAYYGGKLCFAAAQIRCCKTYALPFFAIGVRQYAKKISRLCLTA